MFEFIFTTFKEFTEANLPLFLVFFISFLGLLKKENCSGGEDGKVRCWNVDSGKLLKTLNEHTVDPVTSLEILPLEGEFIYFFLLLNISFFRVPFHSPLIYPHVFPWVSTCLPLVFSWYSPHFPYFIPLFPWFSDLYSL